MAAHHARKARGEQPQAEPRPCEHCGELFVPARAGSRTCSRVCADRAFWERHGRERQQQRLARRRHRKRLEASLDPLPPGVGRTVQELAENVDVSVFRARKIVRDLEQAGYAERTDGGRWRLSRWGRIELRPFLESADDSAMIESESDDEAAATLGVRPRDAQGGTR